MNTRATLDEWALHIAGATKATGWIALCGGILFCAILQWRYLGIDPDFYQFRDDGVITLSHARNWIDFGFIGVGPSGERIEATSAPLQLLLYAAAYAVTGVGFSSSPPTSRRVSASPGSKTLEYGGRTRMRTTPQLALWTRAVPVGSCTS